MNRPDPTPVFRLVHIDCLDTLIRRGAVHAPNRCPADGLPYRSTHDAEVQVKRAARPIPGSPGGTVADYVSFYFGPRGPMLFRLKTGWVDDYTEGQEPLIYLVTHAQDLVAQGHRVAYSDGHGLAAFTRWFQDLSDLNEIDWDSVYARYWNNTMEYPDRQRRKQAEFLVHGEVPWDLISEISVSTRDIRRRVGAILDSHPDAHRPTVAVRESQFYN